MVLEEIAYCCTVNRLIAYIHYGYGPFAFIWGVIIGWIIRVGKCENVKSQICAWERPPWMQCYKGDQFSDSSIVQC